MLALRLLFYAETDIEIEVNSNKNWKEYAKWLEKLRVNKLNKSYLKRINNMENKIGKIVDILGL